MDTYVKALPRTILLKENDSWKSFIHVAPSVGPHLGYHGRCSAAQSTCVPVELVQRLPPSPSQSHDDTSGPKLIDISADYAYPQCSVWRLNEGTNTGRPGADCSMTSWVTSWLSRLQQADAHVVTSNIHDSMYGKSGGNSRGSKKFF